MGEEKLKRALQEYLDIYTRYPAEAFLSKADRKKRHQLLMQWERDPFEEELSASELVNFMKAHPELKYERPFFKKTAPCVQGDIEAGKTDALRFLFEYSGGERAGTDRGYVFLFCEAVGFRYSEAELANMLLAREPEHKGAILCKYRLAKYFLENSIHEAPWGVLYGMNGAEKEHMPSMWQELEEFKELGKKLGLSDLELTERCEICYAAWEAYLNDPKAYDGFADYLEKKCIDI